MNAIYYNSKDTVYSSDAGKQSVFAYIQQDISVMPGEALRFATCPANRAPLRTAERNRFLRHKLICRNKCARDAIAQCRVVATGGNLYLLLIFVMAFEGLDELGDAF